MNRDKIRAKVLSMADNTPFEPASLPRNQSRIAQIQTRPQLSTSKTSISRESYLHSPQHKQASSKQLQNTAKSLTHSKKRKFLNLVSDPHQQSLNKLKKESIVLNPNKLKLSTTSKNNVRKVQSQELNPGSLTRNGSSKSFVSLDVQQINVRPTPTATERIIVREKIVPILIQSGQPTSFYQKPTLVKNRNSLKIEHSNHHFSAVNHKLTPRTQQPHPPTHIPHPQLQLGPHPHRLQPEMNMHQQVQFCNVQPQRYHIEGAHNVSTEFFIPSKQTQRVQIQHSPNMVNNLILATPIRAYSPSQKTFTPIQMIQRNSVQKSQNNINQQIIHKLCSIQLPNGGHLPNQHHLQPNQHQKAITIISDSASISPYPAFRTISKRPLNVRETQSPTRNVSQTKVSFCPVPSTPQRSIVMTQSQLPGKFMNTPSKTSKIENQHQIKHSPKPVKQKQPSIKIVDHSNRLQITSSFISDCSPKSNQTANRSSFFGQANSTNIAPRQNTFLANLRQQLDQLDSKRKQSESRISKRLSELSERASSIAKTYEEEMKTPKHNPKVLGSSNRNICLKQSFCSRQNQHGLMQHTVMKKSLEITLKINKQNQEQGLYLREQIMSRIFS